MTSLMAIDRELAPALKRKKYVLIKPNLTSTVKQLAATHADTLRGILDYLGPRFKGPVIVAEASSGNTMDGFDNFKYRQLIAEYRSLRVDLIDLNREGEVRNLAVDRHQSPDVPGAAGRAVDGPRCVYSERVDTEDARLRGGDNGREEPGDGRSAAQPGERPRTGGTTKSSSTQGCSSRPWALT